MRKAALEEMARLVAADPRVVVVASDLGSGTLAEAMDEYPDRVLMEGIAEQHLVGFAAGLAIEGFIPYVHTIATFLTRRALEQVIVDVAIHDLPVRLIGSGGGMVYAPLGPTHQSIDDFALMRSIPNMTVVAPADAEEMRQTLRALLNSPHPAYVRVAKGGEPDITSKHVRLEFGKARWLNRGERLAVVTTGSLLHECLAAIESLPSGISRPSLVHVPFVKPLDHGAIEELAESHAILLVVEEHLPSGGLTTAVTELLAGPGCPNIVGLTLPSGYANRYGSQSEHWVREGLTAESIAAAIAMQLQQSEGTWATN